MDNSLSAIIKRGKIQSPEEHDIVFEEWKRIFYSGASKEEIMPIQTLLSDWVDEFKKEE
jgi:hypothetical protein